MDACITYPFAAPTALVKYPKISSAWGACSILVTCAWGASLTIAKAQQAFVEAKPRYTVRVERPGDLIYMTYFMVDWSKVKQEPSLMKCTQCGGPMNKVEPFVDAAGKEYDGYVCHADKRVIWARAERFL